MLHIARLKLSTSEPFKETSAHLRGFFATKFNEHTELHNHKDEGYVFKYPLVQYKLIKKVPWVIGINKGAEVIQEIYDEYDEIRAGDNIYQITDRTIQISDEEFGLSSEILSYKFIIPWMSLSSKNYKVFRAVKNPDLRTDLMRKIMIGNLLSMSKSLEVFIPDRIKCDLQVTPKKGRMKDFTALTFSGNFQTNFIIPDYLGIGKSVSRGFGTVKQKVQI